ncbi:kinase-like domain-containing protein [Coemansia spiralis]|nr:kinase-like domain-containing protein [Coemansia spiralis]
MDGYISKLRGLASSAVNAMQSKIGRDYEVDLSTLVGHSGLWALYKGTRRGTGLVVTVWVFEKRYFEQGINRQLVSEREQQLIIGRLKAEASQLARLRHPSVLQVVEPMEETRTSLMFVTEQVIASLGDLSDGHGRFIDNEEFVLDDLEIQKGLLQITKALQFLCDAKLVHGNLVPGSVLVNAKGDWKLGGFGFAQHVDGPPMRVGFEHDYQMPEHTQQDLDFLAPEFVLDGLCSPTCDVFSLGCFAAAVYSNGRSPLDCRNDVGAYRREIMRLTSLPSLPDHLTVVVPRLLTRDPAARMSLAEFQASKYFDNILVATLRYLESLVEQPADQKISFMRNLHRILPKYPDRVLKRKVLTLLLDYSSDQELLPFILPNIMFIVDRLSSPEFVSMALARLKPLFSLGDSPQSTIVLLEHLSLLQKKTPADVFRADVMALVYGALVSSVPEVQDKALHAVPSIAETLQASDLREKLLPRVLHVYARASVLSHKVRALICLHGMLKALDKPTIVEKIMPMLKRTKTREPAVVMAMLAMYEELGLKHLDRQAVATEILPVLWEQCVDGRLKMEQFTRFMQVIRRLGERVEEEHRKYLEGRQRVDMAQSDGRVEAISPLQDDVEDSDKTFETLVMGKNSAASNGIVSALLNPLASLEAKASGWEWDAPSAKTNDKRESVEVDFISDDFGDFASFSPLSATAKPVLSAQKNVTSRLRTLPRNTAQIGATMQPPLLPPPPTSKPTQPVRSNNSSGLGFGQTNTTSSTKSNNWTSQKHTGGKAADLGDFDPFA